MVCDALCRTAAGLACHRSALTSQYVSLIKNSSIAVVVGYPDLVNIGNTVMNQTGQAVEAIAVMMLVYLTISLITSTFMNFYNRLVAIKER